MENNYTSLTTNEGTKSVLLAIAKWAKIMAIISFVVCGLMVILAFSMNSVIRTAMPGGSAQVITMMMTVTYLLVAVITFIPALYLYNFSSRLPKAIASDDVAAVNSALNFHKKYYRFNVIVTMVAFAFLLLAMIIGIIVGPMQM